MVDQASSPQELYEWQKPKPPFQFGRVMNRSFSGLFKNIKFIIGAIVISLVVTTILTAPVYFLDNSDPAAMVDNPIYWVLTILSSILSFLSMMFICVFTDHLAFASFTNRAADFRFVFFRSLKLTIPVFFMVFLYVLASNLGMILLIVPGVIISVGWAIIGPTYLHDDVSLFGSFSRAWQLTSGYKWWVWLATIVMGLIMTLGFTVLSMLTLATSFGSLGTEITSSFTITAFLLGTVFNIGFYIMLALYASFITALYTELRELKEGPLAEEMSAVFD